MNFYVGPWIYGAKVHPAPQWDMDDQDDGAEYGVTLEPSKDTLTEWLWAGMIFRDPVEDAWLPCNAHEVQWKGQDSKYFYKAGVSHKVRRYDLKFAVAKSFAVAKPPKKKGEEGSRRVEALSPHRVQGRERWHHALRIEDYLVSRGRK